MCSSLRNTWQLTELPRFLVAVVLAIFFLGMFFGCDSSQPGEPVNIILDTDLSSDVDDAGAVAVLHALADRGAANILAMMISSGDPWSGPSLAAMNTSFGRPDIPIGVIRNAEVTHVSKYNRYIAEHYPHDFSSQDDGQDAFVLYRKILAAQPDNSVTLVTIGYLSNLSRLLQSGPDQYSPLDGRTLVEQKVNTLICMGGRFPEGREWNFYQDAAATAFTMEQWPTPIIFVGFEIGNRVMTGQALRQAPEDHPLRVAYQRFNKISNRESWDQVAILVAVYFDHEPEKYWSLSIPGKVQVDHEGRNTWQVDAKGQHRYLIWNSKSEQLAPVIDELMLQVAGSWR
jgi:purine nucleosidase